MEKRRFFSVTGRLVRVGGAPLGGARVSLLDQDRVRDDLIARGATGRDGAFSASFTREAFNQDWLEDDAVPHLYLEVRAAGVAFRRDFPGLVRVWQFQTYPELIEAFEWSVRTLGELHRYLRRSDPGEAMSDELSGRVVAQHVFSLVTDGHVQHVDEGWIRPWYPLAEFVGSLPSVLDVARRVLRQAPGIGALRARAQLPAPAAHTSARQRAALGLVARRLQASGEGQSPGKKIHDDRSAARGRAGAGRPAPFEPSLLAEMTGQMIEDLAKPPS